MIELRWKKIYRDWPELKTVLVAGYDSETLSDGSYRLQYRNLKTRIDATGALNVLPHPEYTEWQDVPIGEIE